MFRKPRFNKSTYYYVIQENIFQTMYRFQNLAFVLQYCFCRDLEKLIQHENLYFKPDIVHYWLCTSDQQCFIVQCIKEINLFIYKLLSDLILNDKTIHENFPNKTFLPLRIWHLTISLFSLFPNERRQFSKQLKLIKSRDLQNLSLAIIVLYKIYEI